MGWMERWLRKHVRHDDIGWKEIGEKFTRFTLIENRFFRVFIHKMHAPIAPPLCHDHPWSFVTLILRGGYWEFAGVGWKYRRPGSILFRRAEFAHTVRTDLAWSFVIAGPYRRKWANHECKLSQNLA